MNVKICEFCGKRFLTKSNQKKYCCKTCAREVARRKQMENEQLCWGCKNAYCRCDWTRYSIPVDGWTAEHTTVKDSGGDFSSYKIKKCPKFTRG